MSRQSFVSRVSYSGDELTERAFKSALAAFQGIMTPWNEMLGNYAFDAKAFSRAVGVASGVFERKLAELQHEENRRRCRTWFAARYDWDKDPERLLGDAVLSKACGG
jgi:hypothetical protein